MQTIFALASARTGTTYFTSVFKENAVNCVSRHEPWPDLFGRPIEWRTNENWDALRRAFAKKRRRIERCGAEVYVETSHAFLKSFAEVAIEAFPGMKLLHVFRDPLKAAKSEMMRQVWGDQIFMPFRYYRGTNGKKKFRWVLTGDEAIFKSCALENISMFQWYLLHWIEIENRAMRFLDKYNKHGDCFTVMHPKGLNDPKVIQEMFTHFGVATKHPEPVLPAPKNRNHKPTIIKDEDRAEYEQLIRAVPGEYLEIFKKAPYAGQSWADKLCELNSER